MYKKIMVTLDGSEVAECVLPHVKGFITDCRVETITFVRVIEPVFPSFSKASVSTAQNLDNFLKFSNEVEAGLKSDAAIYLDEVVNRLKQGEVKFQTEILFGRAQEMLLEYSEKNDFDLIIIATHGRSGFNRL